MKFNRATFLVSLLLGAMFAALAAALASTSGILAGGIGFIGFVVTMSVAIVGLNATGIWLSDDVWGRQQRSIKDAVLASFFTCHRLLAVLVLEFLLFLVFMLGLTLVFFICKIPGIGPFLYAFAMPLGVIASGIVLFALLYIAIPLAAPAIWNGTPIMRTIVMLQSVARNRMLKAVIMIVLLGFLTFLVIGFVSAVLISGSIFVASLSAAVLNVSSFGMDGVMSVFRGGAYGMGGYTYAIGFGVSCLFLVGSIPGVLIGLKGTSIIYREVSEGLNLDEDERSLNNRMADMKARADAARQQALAPRTPQEPAMTAQPAAVRVIPVLACPACFAAVTNDDLFCGECGHKLK
ncbi:MAG: zinc ribbon domain-containing protein [Burkholderiales bacterium]|nr:zinc ribbon domain-containing protein [Burkholderiales bacterium]